MRDYSEIRWDPTHELWYRLCYRTGFRHEIVDGVLDPRWDAQMVVEVAAARARHVAWRVVAMLGRLLRRARDRLWVMLVIRTSLLY